MNLNWHYLLNSRQIAIFLTAVQADALDNLGILTHSAQRLSYLASQVGRVSLVKQVRREFLEEILRVLKQMVIKSCVAAGQLKLRCVIVKKVCDVSHVY